MSDTNEIASAAGAEPSALGQLSGIGAQQTSSADSPPPFEELLAELDRIVQQLERGDLPLEQAVNLFERGISLTREGTRQLEEVERKVEVLLGGAFVDKTAELSPES